LLKWDRGLFYKGFLQSQKFNKKQQCLNVYHIGISKCKCWTAVKNKLNFSLNISLFCNAN